MTETEYCNVKALGHIQSALAALKNVVPENVLVINNKKYGEARATLANIEADLFKVIQTTEDGGEK